MEQTLHKQNKKIEAKKEHKGEKGGGINGWERYSFL